MKAIDKDAMVLNIFISNLDLVRALALYSSRHESEESKENRVRSETWEWNDHIKSGHINFNGANVYRMRGGHWRICGHHHGEAYESYKIIKQAA